MKKNPQLKIIITGIIVIGILLIILSLFDSKSTIIGDTGQTDAQIFKTEYESLNEKMMNDKWVRKIDIPEQNPFLYVNIDDIIEKIKNKETFVIYFGFPECPWCRSVLPELISASKDLNIETIYYINILNIRNTLKLDENNEVIETNSGTDGYRQLVSYFENILDDYMLTDDNGKEINTNTKRIYAPTVISVVDGKAVSMTEGISDKQIDAYQMLTEDMRKDSYNKFKETLSFVSKAKTCSVKSAC